MTPEQVRSRVQADKVDYILAQFVDIHGTPRCKGVPARALDLFLEGSAGFAGAAVSGMGQGPHDHDMIAMPDLGSYTLVPVGDGRRALRLRHHGGRPALALLPEDGPPPHDRRAPRARGS